MVASGWSLWKKKTSQQSSCSEVNVSRRLIHKIKFDHYYSSSCHAFKPRLHLLFNKSFNPSILPWPGRGWDNQPIRRCASGLLKSPMKTSSSSQKQSDQGSVRRKQLTETIQVYHKQTHASAFLSVRRSKTQCLPRERRRNSPDPAGASGERSEQSSRNTETRYRHGSAGKTHKAHGEKTLTITELAWNLGRRADLTVWFRMSGITVMPIQRVVIPLSQRKPSVMRVEIHSSTSTPAGKLDWAASCHQTAGGRGYEHLQSFPFPESRPALNHQSLGLFPS